MLKDTEKLVIKGPKGIFTEQDDLMNPHKLCFPHYNCKDTINDFGFVKDFKIEVEKDRYSFFSAKPMNTVLPSSDDIIQVLTTAEELKYTTDLSIINGLVYGDYICIYIGGFASIQILIITKDRDTGEVVHMFKDNSSIIYNNLNSLINQGDLKFYNDFIKYVIKNNNLSKINLTKMYADYTNKQLRFDRLRDYVSSVSRSKICDNCFITYTDIQEHTTHDCSIYTTIQDRNILFNLCVAKMDLVDINSYIDKIGVNKLSEILDEMRNEKSFPRSTNDLLIKDNAEWPIKDAYEKDYITIITIDAYPVYYNPSRCFIRWNILSNYKEYEHYKEMDNIIRKEENEINSLIKSLGKIRSTEAIKQLKDLNMIKTIYKIN